MKLVNLVGLLDHLERLMDQYIANSSIHFEDAYTYSPKIDGLKKFSEQNPYTDQYKEISEILDMMGITPVYAEDFTDAPSDFDGYMKDVKTRYTARQNDIIQLHKSIQDNHDLIGQLSYMINMNFPFEDMFSLEFIRFRYGCMTQESYHKLVTYLEDLEAYFIKGIEKDGYVYGAYLTPHGCRKKVDNVFASLNFERIRISDKAKGTPPDAIRDLKIENEQFEAQIKQYQAEQADIKTQSEQNLMRIFTATKRQYDISGLKDKEAFTEKSFYITGWMVAEDADALAEVLESEPDIMMNISDAEENEKLTPPTKLKNRGIFKPFEWFVEMYGLPNYREMDPTKFMMLSYALFFGLMFGDVGQGLVLFFLGLFGYLKTKKPLMAIVATLGVPATIMGFVYGSFFGNEEILPSLWLRPMDDSNSLLVTAVFIGGGFVIFSIILNLINCIKSKNWGKMLFNQNGIAGLLFYIAMALLVLDFVGMGLNISFMVTVFMIAVPLIIIFLQQPLGMLLKHKKMLPKNKGEFFTESGFELVEIVLSFITNTISFIRVGAFALVHAGMMMVVWQFVHSMNGTGSILVMVLGNAFVMLMEGFIAGIQVLRLEFYELFSRFFTGDGRPFTPFNIKEIKK